MSSLPRDVLSVIAEYADARTLARLRAASKTLKLAGDDAVERTPARKRPAGKPSYRRGTGKHQRLYNRIEEDVFKLAASMWESLTPDGMDDFTDADVMTPEPSPSVRQHPRLRNALHCKALWVFVIMGLGAYRSGAPIDTSIAGTGVPRSLGPRFWSYFRTTFLGMSDLAGHVPPARASRETAVDRILEYAQYKLAKIKRTEKRRKMRNASARHRNVDGHVPLHKLMRGLRIASPKKLKT